MEERLQKILARSGLGSRRKCEELIIHGRVEVNGKIARIGMSADGNKDTIRVDHHEIPKMEAKQYIMMYKPRKVLSDRMPRNDDRQTIHHIVPNSEHLFSVGRLDYDSEGLILLTNDGELKNRLTHPRYGHTKEYRVLLARQPDEEQLATFRRGLVLEDGYRTKSAKVFLESVQGKGAWIRVELKEGHKRQIRETCRLLGLPVVRLIRVRLASLIIGRMKPFDWRPLTEREISLLKGEEVKKSPLKLAEQKGKSNNNKKSYGKSGRYSSNKRPSPSSKSRSRKKS